MDRRNGYGRGVKWQNGVVWRSGGAQGGRERNLRVSGEIKGEAKKGAENGRA
jgi:hypothetical protein